MWFAKVDDISVGGMSKDEVAKYREKLAEFNKNVVAEKYTKDEYKAAKKELEA